MKISQVTITLVALSLLIADCAPAADSGNAINLNGQASGMVGVVAAASGTGAIASVFGFF